MSEYNPNHIPQKLFALIAQKVIILNKKDEILLLRRSEKCKGVGEWSLPGGGLEKGEDPTQSIIREVKEETGLEIYDVKPIYVVSFTEGQNFVVMIGYGVKTKSENVLLNWEHDQFKWVQKDEVLNSNISDVIKDFVKKL